MLKTKANSKEYKVLTDTDLDVQTATVSGNGLTVKLYKSGNVVNAEFKKIGNMPKSGYNSVMLTIPDDFRPTVAQHIYYLGIAGNSRSGDGKYIVSQAGEVNMFTTTTSAIERIVTASWITSGGVTG